MTVETIRKEQMMQLLNDWYQQIRSQNLIKSNQLKAEIDEKIHCMEVNQTQTLFIYYSLLGSRFQILMNELEQANTALKNIDMPTVVTDDFITYYYSFFNAILATKARNYSEAHKHYKKAEVSLKLVHDEAENAEFHYKVSIFYYHIEQPLLASQYALKAKAWFEQNTGYEINAADCENIMGLACISLKQFANAEEHFIGALGVAEENQHEKLIVTIRYNLGLLYADQNLSEAAIHRLKFVYEQGSKLDKTAFLLAREFYKIGESEIAAVYVEKGFRHCLEANNEEYRIHLSILENFNHEIDSAKLESAVEEGIKYFNREELWGYTVDYAEKLAVYFYENNQQEKSQHYFYTAYTAKQKLIERGLLK